MKWIGLTGGIASGKSTVSTALKARGFAVLDADEIARQVVIKDSPGLKSVTQAFGPDILTADAELDRKKLGEKVFGNPALKQKLEEILHPLIRAEVGRLKQELENKGLPVAIYDIPLLFETKAQGQFDAIVVVTSTEQQQRERLHARNKLSDAEIDQRLKAQIPLFIKIQEADFVLHNDRDQVFLQKEIDRLIAWLQTLGQ
jgi:dephospho-CoA kinase